MVAWGISDGVPVGPAGREESGGHSTGKQKRPTEVSRFLIVRPKGFEPPTF